MAPAPAPRSATANPFGVAETSVLSNGSVFQGNYLAPFGAPLLGSVYVPATGTLFEISAQNIAFSINASAWTVTNWSHLTATPTSVTYDPVHHQVDVATWDAYNQAGYLVGLNDSTGATVRQGGFGSSEVTAVTNDPVHDVLYDLCGCNGAWSLLASNSSSWKGYGSPLSLSPTPSDLLVVPSANRLYVSSSSGDVVSVFDVTNVSDAAHYSNYTNSGISLLGKISDPYGPGAMAYDSLTGSVFVADGGSQGLSVINVSTGSLLGTVPEVGPATSVAFDPLTGRVFAATASGSATISVVNGATRTLVENLSAPGGAVALSVEIPADDLAVSSVAGRVSEMVILNGTVSAQLEVSNPTPNSIAYDPMNGELYVPSADGIYLVNASTGAVLRDLTQYAGASYAVYDGMTGDVVIYNGSAEVELDWATNAVVTSVAFAGGQIASTVYDPASGDLYALSFGASTIAVLNGQDLNQIGSVAVQSGASALAIAAPIHRLFAVESSSSLLEVVNTSTLAVVGSDSTGPSGYYPDSAVYDPENGQVYVGDGNSGILEVLNASSGKLVANVTMFNTQSSIAWDPAAGQIVALGSGSALLLDAATDTYNETIPVGHSPAALSYDAQNGRMFVANEGQGTVSTLTTTLPGVSLTVTPSAVSVGGSIQLSVSLPAGVTNATYAYAALPVGCTPQDTSHFSCTPADGGLFFVSAVVNDSAGDVGVGSARVEVSGSVLSTVTVKFSEAGLPQGTSWGVVVPGAFLHGATADLTGHLLPGSYPFLVQPISGYVAGNWTGTLRVSASGATASVVFYPFESSVRFVPVGLPAGDSWVLKINGSAQPSATGTVELELANGTYSFSVSPPSGETATPHSSSILVDGVASVVNVTFQPVAGSGSSLGGSVAGLPLYFWFGVIGAVAAIAVLMPLVLYRRRRPPVVE
ncbi:MAG TPA: hypothetical protein VFG07_03560 [Thermoplasmata archaeon]|nr:hypothetical protein [Thermoplasmata archaeon]